MSFTATGIAFTAMSSNTIDRTNEELRTEQIITKPTQEIASNVGYMTKEKSNLVAFNDSVSGKIAVVSLSSATMDKLKAHFGENDFFQREDGITRLDNKAEAFVGGWFGDIAYKREFLSADENQDGNLDSNEYLDTRNEFYTAGIFYDKANIEEKVFSNYTKVSDKKSLNYIKKSSDHVKNIDEELNKSIESDKNLDSKMSLDEAYSTIGGVDSVLISHTKELGLFENSQNNKNPFKVLSKKIIVDISSDNKSDEELKKQEALAKLMQNGGDISKLSAEERSLLAGELSQYKKEDGSHTVNMDILKKLDKQLKEESDINIKLDKALTKALDENITQKADTNMKEKGEQSKKIFVVGILIQNDGDVSKLTQEDKALIKDEIEHSKNSDGNIDIDKLKHIQEHQRAKENYTAVDIQTPKLYVQKG